MSRPMRYMTVGWWRAERITQMGFLATLGAMLLLLVLAYSGFSGVQRDMENISFSYNHKGAITQSLNRIVNHRMMMVRDIILVTDPFLRDELVQDYNQLALEFDQNFKQLQGLTQSRAEQALLLRMKAQIESGTSMFDEIRSLPTSTRTVNNRSLMNRAMDLSGKVHALLSQVQGQQREDFEASMKRIRQRHTQVMMVLMGCVGLIFLAILYIAYRVSAYVKHSNSQLITMAMEKSMLLATMSHEIRTPLTSIIGFGETLLETDTTKEERIAGINAIVRNGRYLQGVINDVLDFSKLDAGRMELQIEHTSIGNCLDDMDSMLRGRAQSKGLNFSIQTCRAIPEFIDTDPIKLRQILMNLLGNAIKFTAAGEVRLEIDFDRPAGDICFDVIDTGIGIDQEQLSKLFNPYRQVGPERQGGTGLGLYISRQMAQLMGGELDVKSDAGQGSHFRLRLPAGDVSQETLISWQRKEPESVPDIGRRTVRYEGKVLLAEDRKDNQKLFSIYLDKAGADVDIVENGRQAVDAALADNYALILMDVQMPELDGVSATRELRRRGYPGPIIALTASQSSEAMQRCREAGFNDFLSKPISRADFVQVLAAYLRERLIDDSKALEPIYCQILAEEPDLQPAVDYFISQLPELHRNIDQVLMARDWAALKELVHDLKGTAGGVGYPMLTQMAMKVEFALAKSDDEEVAYLSGQVTNLIERIQQGYTLQRNSANQTPGDSH